MELETEEGAKISIDNGSSTEIGRDLGLGFRPYSTDRSVSRRHLSLQPTTDPNSPNPRVSFEVIGKNPILVHADSGGGGERIYRKSERGELRVGDKFTLSLKNPRFFIVKAREEEAERRWVLDAVERREKRTLKRRKEKEEKEKREERDEEEFDLDISDIDPVKEFGFLVKGHEFDQYPKINFKHWNWFLDEPGKIGDGDETDDELDARSRGKRCGRRKMTKGDDGDVDEEWTGESEEENEVLTKGGSGKRPKYSTRSKDPKKPRKDVNTQKDEVEEEEEDETLGGFIVNEEEEEEETEEGESEEEFEEEEEDEDE